LSALVSVTGKAINVIPLSKLHIIPQSPLPNITAPIYLKGIYAAIVKTVPYAQPENPPKITRIKKVTQ
jgi:hypothetical protein